MATPKKQPSGKWRVQVFSHMEGEKRVYRSFTASTKAEAARLAAEYQTNRPDPENPADITVMDCVDKYIDSRRGVLSPSTIREYLQARKYYKPFEKTYVSDLTAPDLQYFVSGLSGNHAPKTVRNIYGLLMAAIKQVDDRRFRVALPAKRIVEYNTPVDAEVKLLVENAAPDLKKAILLAAVGTARRGEVCALEYTDILYDFHAVYIHRDMVLDEHRKWVTREVPKTSGSVRRVILPEEIIDILGRGSGRVVSMTPNGITKAFGRLRSRLGLKCRFHDLRHYSASFMHALGVPDQYIMERGGWSSDRVLKDVYRNTLADKNKGFTARINESFMSVFEKNATQNATQKNIMRRKHA